MNFSSSVQPQQIESPCVHTLSGLTEQLLALGNQVKWPCLYADLQPDTAVYSHPVHFADTILRVTSKRPSVSITAKLELVIFMQPPELTINLLLNVWLMLLDQSERSSQNCKSKTVSHSLMESLFECLVDEMGKLHHIHLFNLEPNFPLTSHGLHRDCEIGRAHV